MLANQSEVFFKSITVRSFTVILLLFFMTYPLGMVSQFIEQHEKRQNALTEERHSAWGKEQSIVGPILSIPYVERISSIESVTDSSGKSSTVSRNIFNNKTLILLPESLNITATLRDKKDNQNTQTSSLYQAEVELSGTFNLKALPKVTRNTSIEWDKAFLAIGLSDTSTVTTSTPLRWEGSSSQFEPGTRLQNIIKNGFNAKLKDVATDKKSQSFRIQLDFKGRHSFSFAPVGEITNSKITSTWPTPSFSDVISPSSKVMSNEGFEATWRIPNLARSYPQAWLKTINKEAQKSYSLDSINTGVILNKPNTAYSKIKSLLNYALLSIGIIFLSLLILGCKGRHRPNLIHYLIIGLSLIAFYPLLFILLEKTSFVQAYQIAAGSIILMITLYLFAAFRHLGKGLVILIILGTLYGTLYINSEMPQYAFFANTGSLLFILLILMVASWNTKDEKPILSNDNPVDL